MRQVNLRPLYASNVKELRPIIIGATEVYATTLDQVKEQIGHEDDDDDEDDGDDWLDM